MIDRVRIYKENFNIEEKYLILHKWKKTIVKESNNTKYSKNLKNIRLEYYIESKRLIIDGRLINLYKPNMNRVTNFDDLLLEGIKFKDIIEEISYKILVYTSNITKANDFLTTYLKPTLATPKHPNNILEFNVSYVEFCFNIKLESQDQVENYITLFNLIALDKDDKRYVNFVLEKEFNINTGCYIKSKNEYSDVKKQRTTINFYNKLSQLKHRLNTPKEYDIYINETDLNEAKNVLRLEVQVGCKYLYESRKTTGMTKELLNVFNVNFAYETVKQKFEYFIGSSELDFYSIKEAKNKINNDTSLSLTNRQKANLIEYVDLVYNYQQEQYKTLAKIEYDKSRKYQEKLNKLGIHSLYIPEEFGVDFLINPIKLLTKKCMPLLNNNLENFLLNLINI